MCIILLRLLVLGTREYIRRRMHARKGRMRSGGVSLHWTKSMPSLEAFLWSKEKNCAIFTFSRLWIVFAGGYECYNSPDCSLGDPPTLVTDYRVCCTPPNSFVFAGECYSTCPSGKWLHTVTDFNMEFLWNEEGCRDVLYVGALWHWHWYTAKILGLF